jgi:hypothetical protein
MARQFPPDDLVEVLEPLRRWLSRDERPSPVDRDSFVSDVDPAVPPTEPDWPAFEPDGPPSELDPASPEPRVAWAAASSPELFPDEDSSPPDRADAGARMAARSFLAQPEPLNRTAGELMPLRIVPSAPQLGQKRGPGSWMPWMTSTRCLHCEQR